MINIEALWNRDKELTYLLEQFDSISDRNSQKQFQKLYKEKLDIHAQLIQYYKEQ